MIMVVNILKTPGDVWPIIEHTLRNFMTQRLFWGFIQDSKIPLPRRPPTLPAFQWIWPCHMRSWWIWTRHKGSGSRMVPSLFVMMFKRIHFGSEHDLTFKLQEDLYWKPIKSWKMVTMLAHGIRWSTVQIAGMPPDGTIAPGKGISALAQQLVGEHPKNRPMALAFPGLWIDYNLDMSRTTEFEVSKLSFRLGHSGSHKPSCLSSEDI